MPHIRLSNIVPKLTCRSTSTSNASFEVLAAINSSPEPTTTLAGTEPGRALYDTPSPRDEATVEQPDTSTTTRSSGRVQTPTEKGSYWANTIHDSHNRSKKILRGKARRLSKSSKANSTRSTDYESDGQISGRAGNTSTASEPARPIVNPAPYVGRGEPTAAGVVGNRTGGHRSGKLNAADARRDRARSPTNIPGTPGQDVEEPEHSHIVEGVNTARTQSQSESQFTYVYESAPRSQLLGLLSNFVENETYRESLSTEEIHQMLKVYLEDSSSSVGPPQRETEVVLISANATGVSGHNHLNYQQIKDPALSGKRSRRSSVGNTHKRQKVVINEKNTDTEPEDIATDPNTDTQTETETEPEPEPEPEPELEFEREIELETEPEPEPTPAPKPKSREVSANRPGQPAHLSRPANARQVPELSQPGVPALHSSRTPIHPLLHRKPNIPLGPTAEPIVVQPSRSFVRSPTTATEIVSPETPPPTIQPKNVSLRIKSSSHSGPTGLRPPPRPHARRLTPPSKPPTRPSMSALPRSAVNKMRRPRSQHASEPSQQASEPSQRASGSSQRPAQEPSGQEAKVNKEQLSGLILDAGKTARVIRERYRRQKIAALAGITLEELDPSQSECDPLDEDLLPDEEEERVTEEAEASGSTASGRKPKPTIRDLFGYKREVIAPAKQRLLAKSLQEGAIQTRGTFSGWADEAWMDTMEEIVPHLTPGLPSTTARQLMLNSLATGRGRFKDPLRSLVQFRLKFIKPATSAADINHNIKLFKKLHPNVFHCTSFDPPSGYYESNIIDHAIASTMFAHANAIGVVFHKFFNPIPLETVAFVLSAVCLEEYETGTFKARDLSMTDLLNKFVTHLKGLQVASKAAKARMKRLRKRWFDFGYEYSGAIQPEKVYYQAVTQFSDIRPDTPEPSDEEMLESEINVERRYTTQAKGKWRARD